MVIPAVAVVGMTGLLAIAGSGAADQSVSRRELLRRAGRTVLAYQTELPRLVATERYVQRTGVGVERHLVSEFGWVSSPSLPDLIGVRDVTAVDGVVLGARDTGLAELLRTNGAITTADASRLLEESARYNLGDGFRNLNLPTVAFFFLHPDNQPRFKWSVTTSGDAALLTVGFDERERPTIIRTGSGGAVLSRGTATVERDTGIVRETELRLSFDDVKYQIVTHFAPVPTLGLTLPASFDEEFITPGDVMSGRHLRAFTVLLRGHATYDNYRRFQTDGRIVP